MAIAFCCIWIAMVLPYLCAFLARIASGQYGLHHNHDPRAFLDALQGGLAKRAHNAQLNAFETNPMFAAAVVVAFISGNARIGIINALAIAFIITRVLFIAFYLADMDLARSITWLVGFALITALFGVSMLPLG